MNRIIKLILILPIFLSVCSCSRNKNNYAENYMIEGHFCGVNLRDQKQMCYFNVTEIGPTEFLDADWINVMQDVVTKKFYKLEFYIIDSFEEKFLFDFKNVKCVYIEPKIKHCCYRDDNKIWFEQCLFDEDGKDYTYYLDFNDLKEISCSCFLYSSNEVTK